MKSMIVLVLLVSCIAVSLQQDPSGNNLATEEDSEAAVDNTNAPTAAIITTDNTNASTAAIITTDNTNASTAAIITTDNTNAPTAAIITTDNTNASTAAIITTDNTNASTAAIITTDNTHANYWSNGNESTEIFDSNVNENSNNVKTPTDDNRNRTTTGDDILTEDENDNSTTTDNDSPTTTKNNTTATENNNATAIENDNTTSTDYYNTTTPYSPPTSPPKGSPATSTRASTGDNSPVITEVTLTDKPGYRGVSEECLIAYTICTQGLRQKGQSYCPAFRSARSCIDKGTTSKSQQPCTTVEQARLELLDCEPSRLFNWTGNATQAAVGEACVARVTECVSASKGVATLSDSRTFVTLFCYTISSDSVCLAVDKDGSFCTKDEYASATLIAKCCSVPALASSFLIVLALLVQTLTAN